MKRILNWLGAKFARRTTSTALDQSADLASDGSAKDIANDDYTVEVSYGTGMPGRKDTHGPGAVLMTDIYGENNDDTDPLLNVLDPSSPDTDESTGFDPRNTAVLRKKSESKPR